MKPTGVKIVAVGRHVPERVITNDDFAQILDTSDEWITSRTGMKRRHWAREDEATSDLAVVAAQRALEKVALTPNDIECYVVATATPDYQFPATASVVAARLGAANKPAFDVEIGCSGFIYGLIVASSLVRAGLYKRVMLIGAETLSKVMDITDRSTAVLFADGAGAVILEASEEDSLLSSELGADGSRPELLYVPSGGSRKPMTAQGLENHEQYAKMHGREVFKFAVTKMIDATDIALKKANLSYKDIDFLIPHQANKRIIDAAAKHLDLPYERVLINIQEYGNTSAASIPIALGEALDAGKIKTGDVIIFVGFGAGLSWGAIAWKWVA